jgi:hypothetical protein
LDKNSTWSIFRATRFSSGTSTAARRIAEQVARSAYLEEVDIRQVDRETGPLSRRLAEGEEGRIEHDAGDIV